MSKGRLGYSATVVKRKQLKKPRRLTDEELLADAARETEKWQNRLRTSNRQVIH